MFARIQLFIARLRGHHNVDAAISGVTKAVTKLEAVVAHNDKLHAVHEALERQVAAAKALARKEADKARVLADRFRQFTHVE